jgi:hypothetical protein
VYSLTSWRYAHNIIGIDVHKISNKDIPVVELCNMGPSRQSLPSWCSTFWSYTCVCSSKGL